MRCRSLSGGDCPQPARLGALLHAEVTDDDQHALTVVLIFDRQERGLALDEVNREYVPNEGWPAFFGPAAIIEPPRLRYNARVISSGPPTLLSVAVGSSSRILGEALAALLNMAPGLLSSEK